MIPVLPNPGQAPRWQRLLADAVTDPRELIGLLGLDEALLPAALMNARGFGLRVPRGYLAKIHRGDPQDPLLRQILPDAQEAIHHPGFTGDPVGDLGARAAPGLLHKYEGRVLLVTTGACAIHCRFCFRRHFPYASDGLTQGALEDALAHIRADASIHEVILSGGDPLTLPDRRLATIAGALDAIPHLRRLRIHTRLPVVLPERVDDGLLDWISRRADRTVMVIHANHPREIDGPVRGALRALRGTGATVLNQSVLLKGVNDNADTLAALSETLFEAGVLPYYLHLLDQVRGAAHFEVPDEKAQILRNALNARLPGYLVPAFVRDAGGSTGKRLLASSDTP